MTLESKGLQITFVKFYQGVTVDNQSNQTSSRVISERTVQDKNLVTIEKTVDGVLITTEEISGRRSFTEIPYNNLAYIKYASQEKVVAEPKLVVEPKAKISK